MSPTYRRAKICGKPIHCYFSPDWRAATDHSGRKNRRLNLGQCLNRQLNRRKTKQYSVSHTRHLGGFALAGNPVGFDLEPRYRATSVRAVARFATPQELKMFDGEALAIWVAKEAAFKSLRDKRQPKTITAVRIQTLRKTLKQTGEVSIYFSFNLNKSMASKPLGRGLCHLDKRTIVGIAIVLP